MKKALTLLCFLGAPLLAALPHTRSASAVSEKSTKEVRPSAENYGRLPLRFERNDGQADARVRYLARGRGYSLLLTETDAVLALRKDDAAMLRMSLVDAQTALRIEGEEALATQTTYLIGNDPARWRKGVPSYERVRYSAVYPGIDLIYYGRERELEFDFVVAPGADPKAVRMTFDGAKSKRIDRDGNLVLMINDGEIVLHRPVLYQEAEGARRTVRGGFVIDRRGRVGFRVGKYDRRRDLVIDPVLSYSTFLGGSNTDQATGIAVDGNGNAYIVGVTGSTDFPLPGPGQIQAELADDGGRDAFVAMINPEGTGLVYATYLGGNGIDRAEAVEIDAIGNAYVTGYTFSTDFPGTAGQAQTIMAGLGDAFVAKLNATGTELLYATYLGGADLDAGRDIAVDIGGHAYITGSTSSTTFAAGIAINAKSGKPLYGSIDSGVSWTGAATGLEDSSVRALALDPTDPNVVYAGTNAGIYKSTDGGLNWQALSTAGVIPGINAIAVHPADPAILHIAADKGVFLSRDGGTTFVGPALLPFDPQLSPIGADAIVIDPALPTTIFAGTFLGVYKSINGGETWTSSSIGLEIGPGDPPRRILRLVIDPANPSTLYAGASPGVFKTTNGGASWIPRFSISSPINREIRALAIDASTPGTIYAATSSTSSALYKTTDDGANWVQSDNGLVVTILGMTFKVAVRAIAVDPVNPQTVYAATTSGVYKSIDGGGTWVQSNQGLANQLTNTLLINPTNTAVVRVGADARSDAFVAKLNALGTTFEYLRFLGGNELEDGRGIAVDSSGCAYITGRTSSRDFPTVNALQSTYGEANDAFVARISSDGAALIYSTYLGGSGTESGNAIAINTSHEVYVGGNTTSPDFPLVNPIKPAIASNNQDGFAARVTATGSSLIYSTYFGGAGTDSVNAIALAPAGELVLTGRTTSLDLPLVAATQTSFAGQSPLMGDAFVARLNGSGTAPVFSTYLGGDADDTGIGISVDQPGDIYIAGNTTSSMFPTVNSLQERRGVDDAFITKIVTRTDLNMTITDSRDPVRVNNDLSYTINVANAGPDTARDVTLTDNWSAPATFISAVSDRGPCIRTTVVTCSFGDIPAGESATVIITIRPNQLGTIANTATVSSLTTDPDPMNNERTVETTVSALSSIVGRITLPNGDGVPGVTVMLSQGAMTTTAADGSYQFTDLTSIGHDVTPFLPGYSIQPRFQSLPNLPVDGTANFTVAACSFTLAPSSQAFSARNGNGSFDLTASHPDCLWTATSSAPWLTLTGLTQEYGNQTINYSVQFNAATTPRSATIDILGLSIAVSQGVNFADVPDSNIFFNEIGKLSALGITSGCGDGNFCPSAVVSREQMAVFLIRALGEFNPPVPTMQRFADVPPENPFYRFIEQMAMRGITSGCGNGNYCPGAPVTREQMAVFIIRALGEFDPPPPAQQRFLDVPPENPFYRFIEEMAGRGITSGCGGGNFCPGAVVTREQMAAFMARAFGW